MFSKINNLRLDQIFALLASLFGLVVILIFRQNFMGLTLTLSALLYIGFDYKQNSDLELSIPSFGFKLLMLFNIIFISLFMISLVVLYLNYQFRPFSYFILISILCSILGLELFIFGKRKYKYVILSKIVFISIFHRAGLFFNYPSLGGTDGWRHGGMSAAIVETGSIEVMAEAGSKYYYYPMHHLLTSSTNILTNMSLTSVHFFVISVSFAIILSIFVFKIGEKLANTKVGLLAALFVNFTHVNVRRSVTNITPGWIVIIVFSIILYIVIKEEWYQDLRITGLLIFFISFITLTHQLTTFVVLISLVCLFLAPYFYNFIFTSSDKQQLRVSIFTLLFFVSFLFLYWQYTYVRGEPFFEWTMRPFLTGLMEGTTETQAPGQMTADIPFYERTILQMFYLILPFFAFGGIYRWVKKNTEKRLGIVIVIISLFAIITFLPMMGSDLLTHRWQTILYILLSIVGAAYIIHIITRIKSSKTKYFTIAIIIFIIIFLMITTNSVNQDNPIADEESTIRDQFNEHETSSARTITDYGTRDIIMDRSLREVYRYYASSDPGNRYNNRYSYYIINDDYLNNRTIETEIDKLILFRQAYIEERISVDGEPTTLPEEFLESLETKEYNKLYDNGEVYMYERSA